MAVIATDETPRPNSTAFESVALLLQGGGALGAYQAGAYEALAEHGIEPTWVAGISIGAINSALIAGNAPAQRIARLREFWELVSKHRDDGAFEWLRTLFDSDAARSWSGQIASTATMAWGVPGFFVPRTPPPYLAIDPTMTTSWYRTDVLKETLERLVDFDRINARETRFSVGAVNVRTGNFAYFDNRSDTIRAEHIMASGALPPAFPAVEIDGEFYWDGGMVSNTPLDWVLSGSTEIDTLIFQIDLWSARGDLPHDLAAVATRMKDIQYSSRTRAATDQFRRVQKLRAAFNELMQQLPPELRDSREAQLLANDGDPAVYNIVQLVYRAAAYEGQTKDFEFSRRTMEDHWRAGYDDVQRTLRHREVLIPSTKPYGVKIYDFTSPLSSRETPAIAAKELKL